MNFVATIQRYFILLFIYISRLLSFALRRLRFVGQGIPIEDKISDFFQIFKTTRLFFLFNLLALFVFTLLPQGKDVILIVIEDLSAYKPWSLFSMLGGLLAWCIISEFGARYKIYVTDNSGLTLTDERVNFRKEAQKFVSSIYLLLPVVIMMISVIVVTLSSINEWKLSVVIPFVIVLLLLVLAFAVLSRFYLDSFYIRKLRKKEVWYKVREQELRWADRLYGIYNDFVFLLRKEVNFKDENTIIDTSNRTPDPPLNKNNTFVNTYKKFINLITSLPLRSKAEQGDFNIIENFPRNYIKGSESIDGSKLNRGDETTDKSKLLKSNELPPEEFSEVIYVPDNYQIIDNPRYKRDKKTDGTEQKNDLNNEEEFLKKKSDGGYYRWIYKNNPSFYKTLHLQVHIISISSIVFIFFISTGYIVPAEVIGSPGLICLSFAGWLGLYTGVLYIDSRYKRKIKVSLRWLLLLWFFIVSYIDNDHPVRNNHDAGFASPRPSLIEHFESWLSNSIRTSGRDSIILKSSIVSRDSVSGRDTIIKRDSVTYPVYFITAEGGGMRTAAFSAMLLARLQDADSNFKKNIYAFSTVSGGSLGVGFFNAINYLEPNNVLKIPDYNTKVTSKFFEQDQLSPVLAKLFYGEIVGNFWPRPIEKFDRAIALEKAWEHSYAVVFNKANDKNVFSTNFLSCYTNQSVSKKVFPAWFINTAEVETGLQCFISNVRPDSDTFLFARQRDLLAEKIRYGINYSTAINFSSRFPIFSPSAAIYQNDDQTYHYVDGGYVENTGSKTMLEVLQRLRKTLNKNRILPYVIQLQFSESDSSKFQKIGFLNEAKSIFSGIYNTRSGSSSTNSELLKREVEASGGQFIEVPLPSSSKDVPMSWVFSAKSLSNLNKAIDSILDDKLNDLNRKLPLPFLNKISAAKRKQ